MPKTVLIVDDNSAIREALCSVFTGEAGFQICGQAADGKEALEKAEQLQPELIIMDLSMPVMNGLEVARIIKKMIPTVRIIMFSEYSAAFEKKEATSAGISSLIPKSEHLSTLTAAARSVLADTAA